MSVNGDPPIGQLFTKLVDDGKRYARAEVDFYKAKAADKAGPIKQAAIFASVAVVIALSAVTALLVGLILALETLVGPLLATLIVVLASFALAGLLGYFAYKRVSEARE